MSDKWRSRSKPGKSDESEHDSPSSNTDHRKKRERGRSREAKKNANKSQASNPEREEEFAQHRSPRSKRDRTKSLPLSTKRGKPDVGSSKVQPVGKESVGSIEKLGEGSRQNESPLDLSPRGVRARKEEESSPEGSERSRSSPSSFQQDENESESSSPQQSGNKTESSVEGSNRDISPSEAANSKKQKLRSSSSYSESTSSENSSARSNKKIGDSGSSSAPPDGNKAQKSSRKPARSRYVDIVTIPEVGEVKVVRSSTDETTDSENSPERPQRDRGGSCDQSKPPQTSSASTDQMENVASSSSKPPMPSTSSSGWQMHAASSSFENPVPSTSSSEWKMDAASSSFVNPVPSTSYAASTECHGQPGSPDGGGSPDKPPESRSSDEDSGQRGGLGDPESRLRNEGAVSKGVPISSLSLQMKEKIFSFIGMEGLKNSCRVSQDWRDMILSLKEPWETRCRQNDFVCNFGEEDSPSQRWRNFYADLRTRLLLSADPGGFKIRDVGCRYRTPHKPYGFYLAIKAFHYFNNKLVIVSQRRTMRVFDMTEDRPRRIAKIVSEPGTCYVSNILSVKLTVIDKRTHVVCLSKSGVLSIWDIEDPKTVQEARPGKTVRRRHSYNRGKLVRLVELCESNEPDKPGCFDLLQGSRLLVATGEKGFVDICNVYCTQETTGGIFALRIDTKPDRKIEKVMLAKYYSPQQYSKSDETQVERREPAVENPIKNPTKEAEKLLLFALDAGFVHVSKVKIYLNDNGVPEPDERSELFFKTFSLDLLQDPQTDGSKMFCYRPTFCFDGTTYLYYPNRSFDNRTCKIYRYNVHKKHVQSEQPVKEEDKITIDGPVDQLLGAGNNYLAYTTRDTDSKDVKLCIMNLNTLSNIVHCTLPSTGFDGIKHYHFNEMHESSTIGKRDWLDGFDGENDKGVLCFYQSGHNNLQYVKWRPKENL